VLLKRFTISSTGKRLLTLVLLFSSIITLTSTVVQLYVEFNTEVDHLDFRFNEINDVLRESLTASTWAFDQTQIQKQLQGILRFEQVAKAQLSVEGFRSFEYVSDFPPNGPVKKLPLIHVDSTGAHEIGMLTVTFTMNQIYGGLIQRGLIILITNFLRTLLVSAFILYLFYRLVTKPFQELAEKAREASSAQLDLMQWTEPPRRSLLPFARHDEVEEMAHSIAVMQGNFQRSYQALKMSENRFRDIIGGNFDYVFETNTEGQYTFVSSNSAPQDPLKFHVVVGLSLFDLPLEEDVIAILKAQAKVLETPLVIEQNSRRTVYSLSISPFYDLENRFIGYRGLCSEVTETILSKERQERQEDQIRHIQKVGLIGELAAGFAHDFNNILAIIRGNVAILNRVIIEIPSAEKAISGIENAAIRGQGLIQKIMTFSARPGGTIQPQDLGAILNSMLPLLRVAVSKKNKVIVETPRGVWRTRVDVSSFENVVINLAINARDAMPDGGKVKFSLANKVVGENMDFCVAGEYVVLTVTDNGVGIPEEIQPRIFEPFFTTKEAGHGTGLGLSTVLNFVQQSYGGVSVTSKVHQGTTFQIYLPRHQEALETAEATP
jgi:signal transduction histidine kinase